MPFDVPSPEATLSTLFQSFEQRSPEGWVEWMSPDYHFDSDDADFHAAHPAGIGRTEELVFATHLFREAPCRCGHPRPLATCVTELIGPMRVRTFDADRDHAQVTVERYAVQLDFDDGSQVALGRTRNEFDLEFREGWWRVTRWQEHVEQGEPDGTSSARFAWTR